MLAADYLEIGAAGWRWVLDQVGWDDGPWIPETTADLGIPDDRDGMHSGTAGLALALAEIQLARGWTDEEQALADGIVDRIRRQVAAETDVSYFLGLTSGIGALGALGAETTDSLARIRELATPDGWSQDIFGPPRNRAGAPVNDVVIGAAGVALGAIWAGGPLGDDVAGLAADVLMRRAEQLPTGPNWPMISPADLIASRTDMPNFSHGTAGVATALALVGEALGRDDLVEAARLGAEHLVTLGDTRGGGFAVPHYLPRGDSDEDEVTYTWCHGPTGTSLLFLALDRAGVRDVAGEPPLTWHSRCLHSVRNSGVPERLHPGFWDNDGRCCGTAGVGDVFLDCYQRSRRPGRPAVRRTDGQRPRRAGVRRRQPSVVEVHRASQTGTPAACRRRLVTGCCRHRDVPAADRASVGAGRGSASRGPDGQLVGAAGRCHHTHV